MIGFCPSRINGASLLLRQARAAAERGLQGGQKRSYTAEQSCPGRLEAAGLHSPDDSRVQRLEQRVSRLNAMVESLSTDEENVKITKLERSIVSLGTRLEGLENNPDSESGTVEVLGERLDGFADELSGLRTNMHQLAEAIEILQDAAGFERNDDDEDEEPNWDKDDD